MMLITRHDTKNPKRPTLTEGFRESTNYDLQVPCQQIIAKESSTPFEILQTGNVDKQVNVSTEELMIPALMVTNIVGLLLHG